MANKANSLMILGTASHVGKSLLTTAFCRILRQEGLRVAPFKAQNMSLNSAATPDGCEIGRAQAMQAEACGIAPTVEMNPVLLKPASDTAAQVIVRGRVWGQVTAADYHQRRVETLFPLVVESYEKLAREYDVVVLEGAGSPAEINLKARDIVNLRMAAAAQAHCILIGDVDRGGVFASLYGTIALLEEHERAQIRGFLINKFRGDENLLTPGVKMITDKLQKPCVGVVHHLENVGLDEEDSMALEALSTVFQNSSVNNSNNAENRRLRVGVIALPYISNFTDFDALAAEPSIELVFLSDVADAERTDVIILPGSKQTIADLRWLDARGLARFIKERAESGGLTVGVCGGMQMLGRAVIDTAGLEGGGRAQGLGLLPIDTRLTNEKTVVPATAQLINQQLFGVAVDCRQTSGYEIHLGETDYQTNAAPLFHLQRANTNAEMIDGATSASGKTFGTYLHGLFDDDLFRHEFVRAARQAVELAPPTKLSFYRAEREARFDRLAAHVRKSVDLKLIFDWLKIS